MVDMDPQGNATTASGVDKTQLENSIYDLMINDIPVKTVIKTTKTPNFDIIPSNNNLTSAEIELLDSVNREYTLKRILNPVEKDYDYIILDCPPSLSMLTVNALTASHGVIIPMQCEYFALEGLTDLLSTIKRVTQVTNPGLKLEGILRTMYDPRSSLTLQVGEDLIKYFGSQVYRTCIPRNIRVAEAPSHGLPVVHYDKRSKGAKAYMEFAQEVLTQNY
jgi:chromosome partitioning protein